jgi:N utilization substance protein A
VQAVVSELGGERIDIVPWHPDPEIFARRALAPAKVAKVLSESGRRVITAIVDEDQLSLAIGRNGQNVRLASQLIGWQIDLYGSREWLERGADAALFGGPEPDYEVADFSLRELDLPLGTLAALETSGYTTFLDIIDLEKDDLLRISGIGPEAADEVLRLIESLTVEEGAAEEAASGPSEAELAEVRELAADILGLPLPPSKTTTPARGAGEAGAGSAGG